MFSKETVLIIEWIKLPEDMMEFFRDRYNFRNDVMLSYCSEFSPFGDKTWKDTLTQEELDGYFKDQKAHNENCEAETVEEFIEEYGLKFDKYLIDSNLPLDGVKQIIIDICW